MPIIDRVKWDADDDSLAWKYPSEELATWTQLIVSESQEAMLVHGGQMEGPFGPGRHTLTTENLPVLRSLFGIPFGGRSPFSAEVWFVNRSVPLDVPWQIQQPLQLKDPEYEVMLPVVASGQYGVAIEHTKRFLVQLVGTKQQFNRLKLEDYLRGIVLTSAKDLLARYLVEKRVSILDLASHLSDISGVLKRQIELELVQYGLRLQSFFVTSVNTLEADPAVQRLKMALADRAARKIQGYTYQQERSLDVMQTAAGNEGSAGGVLGAGMGLGMGVGLGGAFGGAMSTIATDLTLSGAPSNVAGAASSEDRMTRLRAVAELHKEGILTDEEFSREKQRILAS